MKKLAQQFSIILTICFLFVACSSDEDEITNNAFTDISFAYTDFEYEVLSEINNYRESINLSKLNTLNIISKEAEGHSRYMVNTGEINHNNFGNRMNALVGNTNAKSVSENVAYGFITAQGVVNAWLNSEGHRKNIETPNHTDFGISIKQNDEGRNYFTNIFIKR